VVYASDESKLNGCNEECVMFAKAFSEQLHFATVEKKNSPQGRLENKQILSGPQSIL